MRAVRPPSNPSLEPPGAPAIDPVLAHLLRRATADTFRSRLSGLDLSGLQERVEHALRDSIELAQDAVGGDDGQGRVRRMRMVQRVQELVVSASNGSNSISNQQADATEVNQLIQSIQAEDQTYRSFDITAQPFQAKQDFSSKLLSCFGNPSADKMAQKAVKKLNRALPL